LGVTRSRARIIVQVLLLQVEAALLGSETGFAARIAVRTALAELAKEAPEDEAMLSLVRAIEFEADRVEALGTGGLEAQLARARSEVDDD